LSTDGSIAYEIIIGVLWLNRNPVPM
jgi:hypothetical protein